ncbi:unnamed protein product [Clonostachys rosea f. rosea IK726]|uniref:Cytochrome P450 n=2 Tax=Bionectria ochroleuca TaxID=29856 RepID=A0A0B7KE28_BIOOC|nr:unnamed protein product [Clonostachys rosea f. rosea IK726]
MDLSHHLALSAVFIILLFISDKLSSWIDAPKITRHGIALRKAPDTLPFLGNGIKFIQPRQKLFDWFTKCIHRYGREALLITVPSLPPGVIISDPANLDFVFKNEPIFQKGTFFKARLNDLFGNGIVNSDGDQWKRQRKVGVQLLAGANMNIVTSHELPAILGKTIRHLTEKADAAEMVDLDASILEITTQLISKMVYGVELQSQDSFTQAFDYSAGVVSERFQNPLWRLTEVFSSSRFQRALKLIKTRGAQLVSHSLLAKDSDPCFGSTDLRRASQGFLQGLRKALGSDDLVAESALNFLSAGRDTTAQALSWTFYLLMRHPHVVRKIRELMGTSFPHHSPSQSSHGEPSQEAVAYITAVFYETIRLYPPIPFEIKQAQSDVLLPDGTLLPSKSIVVWCTWAMNRSKHTWGEDAAEFHPERWLVDGRMRYREAAEFPVFQGGPRLCLGKKMAEMVAVQVILELVSLFNFSPAYEGEKVSRNHLTLPMEGGLSVYVEKL